MHRRNTAVRAAVRLLRRHWILEVSSILIAAATLTPAVGPQETPSFGCIVCGEFGLADAIRNILLFIPFGIGVVVSFSGHKKLWLWPFLISGFIELAQLHLIQGRDASLGDVIFNGLGGAVGIWLCRHRSFLFRLPPRVGAVYGLLAPATVIGLLGGTGLLLNPAFSDSTYYGQWTPDLGNLEWYRGTVRSVTLDHISLRSSRLVDSRLVREMLLAGALLKIQALAGPAPPGRSSLFSIADQDQHMILLLGPDRDDFAVRYRTVAERLRLDSPRMRWSGVLRELAPGDRLDVNLWKENGAYCLSINDRSRCNQGYTLGLGWAVVMFPEVFPDWMILALSLVWMTGLGLVAGFWTCRKGRLMTSAGFLGLALVLVPRLTTLLPTPMPEWLALTAGLAAGHMLALTWTRAGRTT